MVHDRAGGATEGEPGRVPELDAVVDILAATGLCVVDVEADRVVAPNQDVGGDPPGDLFTEPRREVVEERDVAHPGCLVPDATDPWQHGGADDAAVVVATFTDSVAVVHQAVVGDLDVVVQEQHPLSGGLVEAVVTGLGGPYVGVVDPDPNIARAELDDVLKIVGLRVIHNDDKAHRASIWDPDVDHSPQQVDGGAEGGNDHVDGDLVMDPGEGLQRIDVRCQDLRLPVGQGVPVVPRRRRDPRGLVGAVVELHPTTAVAELDRREDPGGPDAAVELEQVRVGVLVNEARIE